MQITERNCIVTVFDLDTKHTLFTRGWGVGVEIRNRYIKLVGIEKQCTHITIKVNLGGLMSKY